MSNEPESSGHHFPLLRIHVLEYIKLAAQDDEGDGERVKKITVGMVPTKSGPRLLPQLLL